ncbi:aminotransferase class III-fold pyridoxal phosphate-dependent enzyme [Pseudothauera nasutitermitis]|uniref:Aminotransferase class III-fold pyridoxal phosphate-dependent enzyme n=1 Tax=Pseudothauera nasutitermitis TaxID=2565930 RepID=A0A4S4B4D8_9RHOO|nr:aminotransferase class III-fold pyridoxal phosphate-dependent enzyme [Pseudothauera nasutitermitis]
MPATLEHYWLPFTPNRDFKREPRVFSRAAGLYYYDTAGRPILDAVSGLFATAAGHGREEIARAVYEQLLELDFTSSFYRAHPLAFEAASRVAGLLPAGLDRVFLVNSGSEAVDTAIKIALAWHRARGDGQRKLLISRERAYHGVNLGGTALGGLINNRRAFAGVLPAVAHLRHTWRADNIFSRGQPEAGGEELAHDLQRLIDLHGAENIAAVFIEPVAGSTGVLVPPKGYLERVRAICDQHGLLLVFDEVICGFGRTGKAFAAQTFGVRPDILTMAKAITNGAQPMGAVAVDRRIHDDILAAAPDEAIEFFHGYTWSGHPAACAASVAALDLYAYEDLFARGEALAPHFAEGLHAFADLPAVADIRSIGLLGAIELKPAGGPGKRGYAVQKALFDAGLHIKSTGDALIFAPALVSGQAHLDEAFSILRRVLSALR